MKKIFALTVIFSLSSLCPASDRPSETTMELLKLRRMRAEKLTSLTALNLIDQLKNLTESIGKQAREREEKGLDAAVNAMSNEQIEKNQEFFISNESMLKELSQAQLDKNTVALVQEALNNPLSFEQKMKISGAMVFAQHTAVLAGQKLKLIAKQLGVELPESKKNE